MTPEKRKDLFEKTANVAGAVVYILFAAGIYRDFTIHHRYSSIFLFALVTVFGFFFIIRKPPKEVNRKPWDWFIAMGGTFAPMLLRPAPEVHEMTALQIAQIIGTCVSIWGIVSLNRSIGFVAADRGVKAAGAYRFVRHPIYAGYVFNYWAFWGQNLTASNTVWTVAWMGFEVLRIFAEEKVLSGDPSYAEYMKKVRWRILPFVF